MRRLGGLLLLLTGCELIGDVSGFREATPLESSSSGTAASGGSGGSGGEPSTSSSTTTSTSASTSTSGGGGTGTGVGAGGEGGEEPGDPCAVLSGVNVLPNGGVEDGITPGTGYLWEPYQSNLTVVSSPVHEGTKALEVCSNGQSSYSTFIDVLNPATNGQPYLASACLRTMPGETAPNDIQVTLRVKSPGTNVDQDSDVLTSLDDTWQPLGPGSPAVPDSSHHLLVLVIAASGSNSCFVVDSAVVVAD